MLGEAPVARSLGKSSSSFPGREGNRCRRLFSEKWGKRERRSHRAAEKRPKKGTSCLTMGGEKMIAHATWLEPRWRKKKVLSWTPTILARKRLPHREREKGVKEGRIDRKKKKGALRNISTAGGKEKNTLFWS